MFDMKMLLVEYKNIVDESQKAFGHGKKVLTETALMCSQLGLDYICAATQEYLDPLNCSVVELPCVLQTNEYGSKSIFTIFKNISKALKCDAEVVWFTNIDLYLLLYLSLHRIKKKIIVTEYVDPLDLMKTLKRKKKVVGNFICALLTKGMKKIDLTIQTYDEHLKKENMLYMPDYVYYPHYEKMAACPKINRVICLGTMSPQKDIKGLVKAFKQVNMPLLVIGSFTNKSNYDEVRKMASDNVSIENRLLDYDEYYALLASSEYVILPYKMEKYGTATSGVLREAIYLGAKVIAPKALLENMGINGVGYFNIEEVPKLLNNCTDYYNNLEKYKEKTILKRLSDELRKIGIE